MASVRVERAARLVPRLVEPDVIADSVPNARPEVHLWTSLIVRPQRVLLDSKGDRALPRTHGSRRRITLLGAQRRGSLQRIFEQDSLLTSQTSVTERIPR